MAAKFVFLSGVVAVMVQAIFGQALYPGTSIAGNTVVENNMYVANAGNLASLGLGLGNLNLGLGSANLGLGQGGNIGLLGAGLGLADLNVGSSGPLIVTSISPISPTGLAVASENVIEGTVYVTGTLPYLSAVTFEGALPTSGSGVATCGCGTGNVGIIA